MPTALIVALECKFLCQGIAQLVLVNRNKINAAIIIVHQQVVLQQLVAGVGSKIETIGLILDSQARGQHVALVFALMVLVRIGQHVATLGVENAVRIGLLTNKLIIRHPVERQTVCGVIHQAQASSCLVHIVSTFASECVFPETIGSIIEGCYRESKLVTELGIMSHLSLPIEA